jgi:hypothetical protein
MVGRHYYVSVDFIFTTFIVLRRRDGIFKVFLQVGSRGDCCVFS